VSLNDWDQYLSGLRERLGLHGLKVGQVDSAARFWAAAKALTQRPLRPPQAGPTADGVLQFVWDAGEHHLDVDFLPDGTFEWFYRNRSTGELEGQDGCSDVTTVPTALRAFIQQIA
jgi:hypothetical protein